MGGGEDDVIGGNDEVSTRKEGVARSGTTGTRPGRLDRRHASQIRRRHPEALLDFERTLPAIKEEAWLIPRSSSAGRSCRVAAERRTSSPGIIIAP